MIKFHRLLLISIFLLFSKNYLLAEEIKHKDFTIVYDTPELKFYAYILKDYLSKGMLQLETVSGLKFKKKILVNLYQNTDALLNQNRVQNSEDVFFRLDSASSITIILSPANGYYSNLPFSIFIQKKLFYVLFRQNKLLENVWFEEAFFEIVLHELNTFGLISLADLKIHFPFKHDLIEEFKKKEWENARDIENTPENIKFSVEKINLAKTLLLYQRNESFDKDLVKITKYCHHYIRSLKKNNPWFQNQLLTPNDAFIKMNSLKRDLYIKMMENFNTPSSSATQNVSQEYVFRSILRMLIKQKSELAYKLFKELEITPSTNSYFAELGLFFAKKYKKDQVIWLEYFLLNQTKKKPVDFDIPMQVSILLQEILSQEMPDFQVSDQELDFIRTLQFLLYIGKSELILEFLEKNKDQQQNIETKNLIWGIGLLLDDKKIIRDYDENVAFFKSRIWGAITAIR